MVQRAFTAREVEEQPEQPSVRSRLNLRPGLEHKSRHRRADLEPPTTCDIRGQPHYFFCTYQSAGERGQSQDTRAGGTVTNLLLMLSASDETVLPSKSEIITRLIKEGFGRRAVVLHPYKPLLFNSVSQKHILPFQGVSHPRRYNTFQPRRMDTVGTATRDPAVESRSTAGPAAPGSSTCGRDSSYSLLSGTMPVLRRVGVFCGSCQGCDPLYIDLARRLGNQLAASNVTLVYGGASVGLMGAVADACLSAGGTAIGVIPGSLFEKEVVHRSLTELIEVSSMHERKQRIYDLADGFVALPGGLGSLDELAEVVTWNQLGIHSKPLVLVNAAGFWDGLIVWMERAVHDGFVRDEHRRSILVLNKIESVLDVLGAVELPRLHKWIDLDET